MNKINRREFLRLSALAAAGLAVVACTQKGGETPQAQGDATKTTAKETPKPVTQAEAKEAPALAQLVKDGKLPPLNERLPLNPKVLTKAKNEISPTDLQLEIGKYGGTIRTVQPDPAWNPDLFVMCDEPLLASYGILAEDVGGGVAESFEVGDGGKTFTFHLRKGLKWSDGKPVTTEDVRFVYEDFLSNDKITPTFPAFMKTGNSAAGKPLVIEVTDDYTFKVKFEEPYAGFSAFLAICQWKGYTELLKPKHVLMQYHVNYTPLDKLEPLIQKESLAAGEWWTLFNTKDVTNWELTRPQAIGFPNCQPWYVVEVAQTVSHYERNPYYFKVDESGQQLPYIDKLRSDVVADVEMSQMKVYAGEIDFLREDATLDNLALYKENAEKGGYRIQLLDMHVTPVDVRLNLTFNEPEWRKVVGDARFRKALSLATNREQIIDTVYYGYAELPKSVPSEYSPDQAKKLLDEIGMDKMDAEGFRLSPGGQRFEIPFEISKDASDFVPVMELIVEYYKAVGVRTSLKVIESTLKGTRWNANELQAQASWHHGPELWWGALWDYGADQYAPLWNRWFSTNGKEGEEPPQVVKDFRDAINKSIVTDGADRAKAIADFQKLMYDNLFIIVTAEKTKYPLIVNKKLGNVPTAGFAIAANFAGEQLFYKE